MKQKEPPQKYRLGQVNSKSLYSLMQGKTRKKQYYTQVARQ